MKKKKFNGEGKLCGDHYNDHNDDLFGTKNSLQHCFNTAITSNVLLKHKTWYKCYNLKLDEKQKKKTYFNTTLSIMMNTQTFHKKNFDNATKSKNLNTK
jgi:hypothetical protein